MNRAACSFEVNIPDLNGPSGRLADKNRV